jgi:hypothetical protein
MPSMIARFGLWFGFVGLAHAVDPLVDDAGMFSRYQAWQPIEVENWVNANARVHEIGGWRYYAREPYLAPEARRSHLDSGGSAQGEPK